MEVNEKLVTNLLVAITIVPAMFIVGMLADERPAWKFLTK
jgi:hypothetical protein